MFWKRRLAPDWRKRLAELRRPWALFFGWFPLLWTALELAHKIHAVESAIAAVKPAFSHFMTSWGWLIGLAVLIAAALGWPETHDERQKKEHARRDLVLANLRADLVDLMRKFDHMMASKQSPLRSDLASYDTVLSAGKVLKDLLGAMPEKERWRGEGILRSVLLDYCGGELVGELGREQSHVTTAIEIALDMPGRRASLPPPSHDGGCR